MLSLSPHGNNPQIREGLNGTSLLLYTTIYFGLFKHFCKLPNSSPFIKLSTSFSFSFNWWLITWLKCKSSIWKPITLRNKPWKRVLPPKGMVACYTRLLAFWGGIGPFHKTWRMIVNCTHPKEEDPTLLQLVILRRKKKKERIIHPLQQCYGAIQWPKWAN